MGKEKFEKVGQDQLKITSTNSMIYPITQIVLMQEQTKQQLAMMVEDRKAVEMKLTKIEELLTEARKVGIVIPTIEQIQGPKGQGGQK
jgi:hypothetical protein